MRFLAVKTAEQQAVLMLHESRELMVRQRTMLINALRGHLHECGIVTGIGKGDLNSILKALHERKEALPVHTSSALDGLAAQLRALDSEIGRLEVQTRMKPGRRDEPTPNHDPGYLSDHHFG